MHLLAEEGLGVDINILTQYGVLGVFAILLIIFAKTSYKREVDNSDALKAENRDYIRQIQEQHERVQDRIVPALIDVTNAMKEASELVVEQAALIRELRELHDPPAPRRRRIEGS